MRCACAERTNQQVLELLNNGDRHEQPANCTRELYEIMLKCWNKTAEQRPTFEYLFYTMDDYNVAVASSYADT